jgi:two-component system, NarL family, sensor histidine kinase UhpB
MTVLRLLHVEDSPDDAALVLHALRDAPFEFTLTRVETEPDYLAQLESAPPDVIICDYNLPQFSAERALEIIRARDLDLPFIVVSHHLGESEAVLAMQQGASDYLPKRSLGRLPKAIASAVDRCNARREKVKAQEALRESEAIRRGILDSLLSQIVLVDGRGVIMAVNKAWETFELARSADAPEGGHEGTNYLEALRAAHQHGDASAGELAEGLRAVIAREKKLFSMEYQVSTGSGTRWYVARATPLEGSDEAIVISHRDVSDSMISHVALEHANKRLRGMSKRLLAVQEEERRAISRELHDDIGQTLGALKIGLHRLGSASAAEQPVLLSECLGAAAEALDKLRHLAMDLRPPQLDQLGLKEALEWLAQRQSAVTGIVITCTSVGLDTRPPAALEGACYRIAQEALNNATRHARAKQVAISVESDGALLKLVVRDDGVGFDEPSERSRVIRSGSMGLIGMEERAQLAGGRLKLRSVPGGGTTVSAIFPLAEREQRETTSQATLAAS